MSGEMENNAVVQYVLDVLYCMIVLLSLLLMCCCYFSVAIPTSAVSSLPKGGALRLVIASLTCLCYFHEDKFGFLITFSGCLSLTKKKPDRSNLSWTNDGLGSHL